MELDNILGKARKALTDLTGLPVDGVIGVSRDQGVWVVTLEALERRAIPDTMDILGTYELRLSDDDGEVQGLERKKLRKRGETKEED